MTFVSRKLATRIQKKFLIDTDAKKTILINCVLQSCLRTFVTSCRLFITIKLLVALLLTDIKLKLHN